VTTLPGIDGHASIPRVPAAVRVWDVDRFVKRHHADGNCFACSPDGKVVATWSTSRAPNEVGLWDLATGRTVAVLRPPEGGRVTFSPDGKALAAWSPTSPSLTVWDVGTGKRVTDLRAGDPVESVAFAPDGKTLAVGESKAVRLWDTGTWRVRGELAGPNHRVGRVLAFSPDGTTVATVDEAKVRFWDAATGKQRATLEHSYEVGSVLFAPDGRTLATSWAGSLPDGNPDRAHSVPPRGVQRGVQPRWPGPPHPSWGTSAERWEGVVTLWDPATGQERATVRASPGELTAAVFSPDGRRLVTVGGVTLSDRPKDLRDVRLWDAFTGEQLAAFQGHTDRVTSAAFSPGGELLATGSSDKTVKLWDAATGQELVSLRGWAGTDPWISVGFSRDGKALLTAGPTARCPEGEVQVWPAATEEEVDAQR
jgi:WD40 repeat protein